MNYFENVHEDVESLTKDLSPIIVETIRLDERIKIFEKFRNLIHSKEYENDHIAASVLGWAYEKLAE